MPADTNNKTFTWSTVTLVTLSAEQVCFAQVKIFTEFMLELI